MALWKWFRSIVKFSFIFSANRRVLFDLKKNGIDGLADGMTIDTQNNIWVAVHASGKVSYESRVSVYTMITSRLKSIRCFTSTLQPDR